MVRCRWMCRGGRRKWEKMMFSIMMFILITCLLFYLHLVYSIHGTGKANPVLLLNAANFSFVQEMDKKIMEIKKNIVDIEYQGEYDENPSKESLLGILAANPNISIKRVSFANNEGPRLKPRTTLYKKTDMTKYHSTFKFHLPKHPPKRYLYLLGHYEQLGKTVVNFMHAGLLAAMMKRGIVVPFVKNSRFCGLREGWIGSPRRNTREFLVMDNYFDLTSVDNLFQNSGFSNLIQFDEFKEECSQSTMLYFIYSGGKAESKRYFKFSELEYAQMESRLANSSGIIDCSNVERKVKSGQRMKDVTFVKAFCVNAEKVTRIEQLNKFISESKCLSLFLWRGIGPQRTHFNLSLPMNYEHYLSRINFSDSIMEEANNFINDKLYNQPYIGIQIRSERQLGWYGLAKFKHCLDLVIKVASIFVYQKKIRYVFVSSDLEKHGSDQLNYLLNKTVLQDAKDYFQSSFKKLSVALYEADKSRGLIHNDAGYVALTQMEILSRSQHLITLGAGTFQSWVKASFKKNKRNMKDTHPWSITRVCYVEVKKPGKKKKGKINSTASISGSRRRN